MFALDPTTREKFARFRHQRRAWVSFWLLLLIFVVSLFSELVAHGTPWRVRFEGETYYPRLPWSEVTRDTFYGDGLKTLPNYRRLERSELFAEDPDNRMWWSPIPVGPHQTLSAEDIDLDGELRVRRRRVGRMGTVNVSGEGEIVRASGVGSFFREEHDRGVQGRRVPEGVLKAVEVRMANEAFAPEVEIADASERFTWRLSEHEPRARGPRTVRITLREHFRPEEREEAFFSVFEERETRYPDWWEELAEGVREEALGRIEEARRVPVRPLEYEDEEGRGWELRFELETVHFPFRPVKGHPFGFDSSGRDVFVLILYATRISLLFGFTLVFTSMVLGTFLGALQGYFGGLLDLISQRLIEIYEAIPFLYVMIFIGSVFGRSFGLLLFVYAMFNWIGISYYLRAEFLRLRSQPFTEAARALGLPTGRIMWRHLLPNALVPLVTFFPFMLVGAVGSLSALDYLGFGLPAGTPSWGVLLRQAQEDPRSWWLVLFPSLALFVVILLSVFIGEGLRAAFDPKREAHWEA